MREDVDRQDVRFDDIASKLDEHDAAKFAFGLFDLDGDGYVIEPEVQGRFHKIYMCVRMTCGRRHMSCVHVH